MPSRDEELGGLTSVASFFVSRVDTKADPALASNSPLRGRIAVANAKRAYDRYLLRFSGSRWERLEALGARPQRPLWASTGTKNPDYSDVLYVEQLIGAGVINTMPDATLRAFRDHGRVEATLDADSGEAETVLAAAAYEGLDLEAITARARARGRRVLLQLLSRALALHRDQVGRDLRPWRDSRLTRRRNRGGSPERPAPEPGADPRLRRDRRRPHRRR